MRRKDLVLVFGQPIPIEYVESFEEHDDKQGDYDVESQEIRLAAALKGDALTIATIHEMGHALFQRLSFSEAIDSQTEEIIIDTFAKMMVENFKIS